MGIFLSLPSGKQYETALYYGIIKKPPKKAGYFNLPASAGIKRNDYHSNTTDRRELYTMNIHSIYLILWLFFLYSIGGWFCETTITIIRKRKIVNRGVLNGPLCMIYGITALIITIGFGELQNSWFFLFLGCTIIATVVEWLAGHFLEKVNQKKWWDYSNHRFQMDGYICLEFSILWGIIGTLCLKFLNPVLLQLYHLLSGTLLHIILLGAGGIFLVDAVGSYASLTPGRGKYQNIRQLNYGLAKFSRKIIYWIYRKCNSRIEKAYPNIAKKEASPKASQVFAEGCCFYKLAMLFFIGAFLGDVVETIFCRLTSGVWMSRSSVVLGPFSIVWGIAMSFSILLFYNYRNRSDSFLFAAGTLLGGVYEYLCSVFTEIAFGKVFWDYSDIPFNLGGRINLLYCFFWGIAAVIWVKKIYPPLSSLIEKIPLLVGSISTWLLIIFMCFNIILSSLAMARYTKRQANLMPENSLEQWLDTHYNNEKMEQIYPNAISTDETSKKR